MTETMTKGERDDLQRLIRQREKVLKSAAKQRSTELLADFENQLGTVYAFDDDEVWAEAEARAEAEIERANERIARRCAELGIPKRFAPQLVERWLGRGENAVKERRAELRKMAITRIAAIEQEAIVKIELSSVNAQTEIATHGLTSEAARSFIEKLPSVVDLMPALAVKDMADEAEPPIAEQLVSPNTLRQRRFRERKAAALRNASQALQAPSRNGGENEATNQPIAPAAPAADDDLAIPEFLDRTRQNKVAAS
jgi:hypothetical protein